MMGDKKEKIGIIIPALNSSAEINLTLLSLKETNKVFDVDLLLVDGGSVDNTIEIAKSYGARIINTSPNRGNQLALGALAVKGDWMLFIHADTKLEEGWIKTVNNFIKNPRNSNNAAYFRLGFNDQNSAARRLEKITEWRCRFLKMPYGDQGLLIKRSLYNLVGGYQPMVIMEDVDLIRRLKPYKLIPLPVTAITSANRYSKNGYLIRSARNLLCLTLYYLGIPIKLIHRIYG